LNKIRFRKGGRSCKQLGSIVREWLQGLIHDPVNCLSLEHIGWHSCGFVREAAATSQGRNQASRYFMLCRWDSGTKACTKGDY